MDDLILLSQSFKGSIKQAHLLGDAGSALAFITTNAQVVPSRSAKFLGTQVNSTKMQFWVPEDKIRSTCGEICLVLSQTILAL